MKRNLTAFLIMLCAAAYGQQQIPLYPDGSVREIEDGGEWEPSLTVFLPEKPNGQAILLCPGGAYQGLSVGHEGTAVAKWLNTFGTTGIVLRYRMPRGRYEVPEADASTAMRIVRTKAVEWGIDPIMGSSAGGHLAATVMTRFDEGDRPDFGILFYPVITMKAPYTHGGSKANLIGTHPDKEIEAKYCTELQVNTSTPPAFIALSSDDLAVKPQNSTLFYNALTAAGVHAELHAFPDGGHGWGIGNTPFKYYDELKTSLARWLAQQRAKAAKQ